MISVNVYQRSIEADCAFVKRDQLADGECIGFRNTYRDRFASFFIKRRARSAEKSMQIIAAGNVTLHFERGGRLPRRSLTASPARTGGGSIFRDLDECDKEI